VAAESGSGGVVKAVRWHRRGEVRVEDVPMPKPAPDEVRVRVEWCGICGTDLEEYRHGPVTIPIEPHPARGTRAPIILGHEVVGIVDQPAADGTGPAVGARVVPDVVIGCGGCWWCLRHEEGLCPRLAVRGQTEDGGLAEFMVARASTCVVVPESLPSEEAALTEPAAVAVRALRKIGGVFAKRIAVVGAGTVGQLVIRTASALGACVEVVVDPVLERRQRAIDAGVRAVADGAEARAAAASVPLAGYDAVVECSGARGALALAVELARRGGTVVAVGIRSGREEIDAVDVVLSEKRIVGSAAHLWDDDCAVALGLMASGRVRVGDLISDRVPLNDAVEHGFAVLEAGRPGAMKVLVQCG
jgi:2-desacetyl-2-hydroxyethyl bacteriochlorophyllide A dehydrogenase